MCEFVMPDLAAPAVTWQQWRDALPDSGLSAAEVDLYSGLANAVIAGAQAAQDQPDPFAGLPLPTRQTPYRQAA